MIEGYPAYPIYRISTFWTQDGVHDPKYPKWHEGLPEGRIHNSNHFSKMFKQEQSSEALEALALEHFDAMKNDKSNAEKNFELVNFKIEPVEYETWHCTWFQHETFDVGQTDSEALNSFKQFVSRINRMNEEQKHLTGNEKQCLMGAEDEWRWHGAEPSGGSEDHSPAPCRCVHCKEQGVLRIAH